MIYIYIYTHTYILDKAECNVYVSERNEHSQRSNKMKKKTPAIISNAHSVTENTNNSKIQQHNDCKKDIYQ